jgi:4-amino-4-deoxy-L-arabinose transferase-like glycosyltransferase
LQTTTAVPDLRTRPAKNGLAFPVTVAAVCVALSALATVPFFFIGRVENPKSLDIRMPVTHDMHLHFEQMKSFDDGLASGELYPRWEEDTNRHFGAPTTSYYPPGVYYLTSALYTLLRTWWRSLLAAHLLMMVASAAALYFYARRSMSRGAAAVAMVAYIFLPYHIIDQYQRGAIAELLGFIWMPLMLFFGERLFRVEPRDGQTLATEETSSNRLLDVAGLAATYGAFLWSHPPTAYQFTLAFGLFVLLLALRRRDWRGLVRVGLSMLLGIGLSGAYLIAASIEQDLIRHEYVSTSWPYHMTYVFVHNLPYRQYHLGFFHLVDAVWVFSVVSLVVAAVAFFAFNRGAGPGGRLKDSVVLWVVMGSFAAFMMTQPSYYVGSYIPKIDIGVFTWRMLSISTLVGALLAGACVESAVRALSERRRAAFATLGTTGLVLTICAGLFSGFVVVKPMWLAPAFVPSLEHINLAMIPRTAPKDPLLLPHLKPAELAEGNGDIVSITRWDPEHRELEVMVTAPDLLKVRTFYFPGWVARVDGEQAEITVGRRLGEIQIELEPGTHNVRLDFTNTTPRRVGEVMTVAASVLLCGLLLLARRRKSI